MDRARKFVSKDEFDKILQVVDRNTPSEFGEWFGLLLETTFVTGCRPAELVGRHGGERVRNGEEYRTKHHPGLRPCDLVDDERLYVQGKNTTPEGRTEALKARTVLCSAPVWKKLETRAMEVPGDEANLFLPEYDWPLRKAQREVRALQQRLTGRLKGFSLRWLRHSHAVFSLRNGVDLVSVQRQLGHESLTTTATYLRYAGLDDDAYLAAFGGQEKAEPDELRTSCPSCGFDFTVDRGTGEPTWESRMGRIMEEHD